MLVWFDISQHLMDIAASKVSVDLPGNGPFCFRLLDYFAVGCLYRGCPPHRTYVKDDLSDLVDVCRYYVENEEARQAMGKTLATTSINIYTGGNSGHTTSIAASRQLTRRDVHDLSATLYR